MEPIFHEVTLRDRGGKDEVFRFDSANMRLLDQFGVLIEPKIDASLPTFGSCGSKPARVISPTAPGRKSRDLSYIKLLLGFSCNFNCTYCNQRSQTHDGASTGDPEAFVEGMSKWCSGGSDDLGSGLRMSLWGGEPFVYWSVLKKMVPALRRRYPHIALSMVTNGSLLTQERVNFVCENDINLMISHDGPGHYLRGVDPLKDSSIVELICQLLDRRGKEKVGFNCVLTRENCSLSRIHDHIAEALGREDFGFSTEGVVQTEDDGSFSVSPSSKENYEDIYLTLLKDAIEGGALKAGTYNLEYIGALRAFSEHPEMNAWGQRCGLDRDDVLAVDLAGNVLTCQNEIDPSMRIGHVNNLDAVRLNTSYHFMARESCVRCPVVQLCKGGCMHQTGVAWETTCRNHYHYHLSVLATAIFSMTGKILVGICSDDKA
ncbi:radical SAM/SPASM domain-containing protein [Magnetospirillum molischianum]|uniref:Radical SAM core domain-containing protein n=1 Tax=Magnetospirillum molischianum DSM 120 TaxID=1150626 RepID=H8FY67_MAGML|nr:SPASM domain-containing protein [Magnetospirillum molischianum]CCG43305.1 hypothetical protein PHAMO_80096 [Magnetospirillum molischianum DSM 120]